MVSIIIPLYNKRFSIFSTIDSVLNQTYKNFELLIIDDGSSDGSADIVKSIQDDRIRYIRQKNGGVSSARNHGIKEAKYEWILFLDADDYLIEDGLEHLVDGARKYQGFKVITDVFAKSFMGSPKKDILFTKNRFYAYTHNLIRIRTGNTLFHKDCFVKCGLFDERLSFYEDFGLFAKIVRNYYVAQIGYSVFAYETDFCGLSTLTEFKPMDYLMHIKMTGDVDFDKCYYNFIGMRLQLAKKTNNNEIISFINSHFDTTKASRIWATTKKIKKLELIKSKCIIYFEILIKILSGHIETNRKCLLSLSPSKYRKYGKNVYIGKHCMITKCSKVFIYDNVEIGDGLCVKNERGKFIVRSGTKIGKNLTVITSDETNKMNVIIGCNVTIGDNITLTAGTYIKDGETIFDGFKQ